MAPVKRGFSQKILWPTPALVGLVAEVLRFAAHCPHEKPCVLIIDECEKLDLPVENLWGRLQAFWDLNKDGTRMLLVFSARISPWGIPTTKRSCLPGEVSIRGRVTRQN